MNGNGAHDKINTLISLNELLQSTPPVSTGVALPELYSGVSPASADSNIDILMELQALKSGQMGVGAPGFGDGEVAEVGLGAPAISTSAAGLIPQWPTAIEMEDKLYGELAQPDTRVIGGPGPILENIALTPLVSAKSISGILKKLLSPKAPVGEITKAVTDAGGNVVGGIWGGKSKTNEFFIDVASGGRQWGDAMGSAGITFKYNPKTNKVFVHNLHSAEGGNQLGRAKSVSSLLEGMYSHLPKGTKIGFGDLTANSINLITSQASKGRINLRLAEGGLVRQPIWPGVGGVRYSGLSKELGRPMATVGTPKFGGDVKKLQEYVSTLNKRTPKLKFELKYNTNVERWEILYKPFEIITK